VEKAIQASPVADPGPEFWQEFSREMHLKLVQAEQAGQMAPAPRSAWWVRLPYLVGGPALAGLLLWVAVGYLHQERPLMAPAPQVAKMEEPAASAPKAEMAKEKSAPGPAERMAVAPPSALPRPEEAQNFVYVSKTQGQGQNGEDLLMEDDLEDLDSTLARMTPQEREAFLKKLSQHKRDGSCIKKCSAIVWA